ncbi:WYL domain-containing protein [Wohlfahrtiimonas chitiniclastica]|uniref:WYL domain-containing protein n=1 Tax=Wohlfahrtiimonas chitiniclastica TaxID=400946 RepID=A0AB35BXK1_9GAMM|nr:WYL domain-containing protein [Wohlfahrtiimonas chitiniclastica]MBS7825014.1 WYL domain-containing protein [Wohlfahrtiimonas chitiniclastica]MBS7840619.1 WYL domain-containing protein [Wohlfahrtiimonas chitiniclastica]
MNTSLTLFHRLSDRSRFVEFCLKYKGVVSRADLMEKFSLSEASATRAIKAYLDESIEKSSKNEPNALFNKTTKVNDISENFESLFNLSEEEVFHWLQLENQPNSNEYLISSFNKLNLPYEDEFAPIVRSIVQNKCIQIIYLSISSGEAKERTVVPHAIFSDGLRLYIRVFDRIRKKFLDLASARIVKAIELNEKPKKDETRENDYLWNDYIELNLIAHPKLPTEVQEVIKFEYKMIRDRLKIMTRKSTINYFLRVWNIDCSDDASLDTKVYHLKLENIASLSELLSPIAPGYR